MLYNQNELPKVAYTAGKVTIATVLAGIFVFAVMFVVDFGAKELNRVSAQTATTTLTVLNTPPAFVVEAFELTPSATATPTNSDDDIVWNAVGFDSNGAEYFLLVCDTNATPTANAAPDSGSLGTVPPNCNGAATQWAVSTGTASNATATAATTTTEDFAEVNEWFAWVCDDDPVNPRCNTVPTQGSSTSPGFPDSASPFHVNKRPQFSALANDGPVDPAGTLLFSSTSSDPDTVGGADDIFLVICQSTLGIDTTNRICNDSTDLASTTGSVQVDASASYTLAAIVRDATYPAYGYLVDEHGHIATTTGPNNSVQADFTVNNVAPVVLNSDVSLNGGADLVTSVPGGETTGFTLEFTATDANSCVNSTASSTQTSGFLPSELEMTDFITAVFTTAASTTCDGSAGPYDPNTCYPSGVSTSTWNLNCTASSTSCGGASTDSQTFECTFPLWFVANPTDASTNTPAVLQAQNWLAGASVIDDDSATSTFTITNSPVDLISFTALDLITAEIPYGDLEPGDNTGSLNATTTTLNVGNTGLDQEVRGESMCPTFSATTTCPSSASSTIPESEQQFASSSLTYNSPFALTLSSSTDTELEFDVNKTTSTSTPNNGITYWGIEVPLSITLAGTYSGLNTYTAVTAEAADWGI